MKFAEFIKFISIYFLLVFAYAENTENNRPSQYESPFIKRRAGPNIDYNPRIDNMNLSQQEKRKIVLDGERKDNLRANLIRDFSVRDLF